MAITATTRSGQGNGTAGTSYVYSVTSAFAIARPRQIALVCLVYDPASGAASDPFSTITDVFGNIFYPIGQAQNATGVNAGVIIRMFFTRCEKGIYAVGSTITTTFSTSVTRKCIALYEISSTITGQSCDVFEFNVTATTGNSTTPSITTSSIVVGDCVVAMVGVEGNPTVTADSDTTNGSWGSQINFSTGTSANGIAIATQAKVTTTAAGTQTYNPTLSAAGLWACLYVEIDEINIPIQVSNDDFFC